MKLNKQYKTLRLILGDQLNSEHSWFEQVDDSVLYLIAELHQETVYVKHHIQKMCAFFSAMEQFSDELKAAGYHVLHLTLDDTKSHQNLGELISTLMNQYSIQQFQYQRPDEYRLLKQLRSLLISDELIIEFDSEHFLLEFDELPDFIKPAQHNRLETFYRKLRQRFNILMEDGKPIGGKWNYDEQNREKLKPKDLNHIPQPLLFSNPVKDIKNRIDRHNVKYFGHCDNDILWPVNREQSLQLLSYFCDVCLPNFGRFQDAMTNQHSHQWSLFHSRLSFSLNTKILNPAEVIEAAVNAFENSKGVISLAQIEGFVRQILGWREYVRSVYWVNMPNYTEQNTLNATGELPDYFWNGNTKMECMKQAIQQSLDYAYAHHIQRLMITGNFCLLTGIDPNQVDQWYLGIYIDAIEWVEMPNTRGMSQFADGGWVATKPYSAGGNYVNKMSDYCKTCVYSVKEKVTENACPLNSLYWRFMVKHRDRLEKNPRIGMVYRSWDKQDNQTQEATLNRAEWCIDNIEKL